VIENYLPFKHALFLKTDIFPISPGFRKNTRKKKLNDRKAGLTGKRYDRNDRCANTLMERDTPLGDADRTCCVNNYKFLEFVFFCERHRLIAKMFWCVNILARYK
jgi:hypothetical protein